MSEKTRVFVGSDHAGFALKADLLAYLSDRFTAIEFEDLGCYDTHSVDYPDIAAAIAKKVVSSQARGILICGSGIGVSIAANKVRGIRAALAWDATSARLSREHNDANVLCLGSRLLGVEVAKESAGIWLTTPFSGGRHEKRVRKIGTLEIE